MTQQSRQKFDETAVLRYYCTHCAALNERAFTFDLPFHESKSSVAFAWKGKRWRPLPVFYFFWWKMFAIIINNIIDRRYWLLTIATTIFLAAPWHNLTWHNVGSVTSKDKVTFFSTNRSDSVLWDNEEIMNQNEL